MKAERDIEKTYPNNEFVEKLRRLADAIEKGVFMCRYAPCLVLNMSATVIVRKLSFRLSGLTK